MSVGSRSSFRRSSRPTAGASSGSLWLSIVGLGSAATFMGLTVGQSQTMKTAWIGDMLAIIPPVGSLVAMRFEFRPATRRFPFGYFRAISVAFLVAAAVLSLIGLWLLYDALLKLLHREHPSIGMLTLFGRELWAGWAMVAALAYSSIIGFTLGALKRPLARKLHDKALEADADSNKADWMSEASGSSGLSSSGSGSGGATRRPPDWSRWRSCTTGGSTSAK